MALALLAVSASGPTPSGFGGSITMKMEQFVGDNLKESRTVTFAQQGQLVAIVLEGSSTRIIVDKAANTMTMLTEERGEKRGIVMQQPASRPPTSNQKEKGKATLTKSSPEEHKQIVGIDCVKWNVEDEKRIGVIWVSDMSIDMEAVMAGLSSSGPGQSGAGSNSNYYPEVTGFTMESDMSDKNGNGRDHWEVIGLNPIPDPSMFSTEGYQMMSMPTMPAGMPGYPRN
jgi:hypothetical protein